MHLCNITCPGKNTLSRREYHLHVSLTTVQVEAAFTRHRQKMGRTAFLNVVRRKGVVAPLSSSSGGADRLSSDSSSQASLDRAERCKPDGAAPKSPVEDVGGMRSSFVLLKSSETGDKCWISY